MFGRIARCVLLHVRVEFLAPSFISYHSVKTTAPWLRSAGISPRNISAGKNKSCAT